MKRAGRIVYLLLSGLSLLLLLATAGAWARSYWVDDDLSWCGWPADRSVLNKYEINCARGGILFAVWRFPSDIVYMPHGTDFQRKLVSARDYPIFGDVVLPSYLSPKPRRYAGLGFEWIPQFNTQLIPHTPTDSVFKSLTVPLYFLCLLFAILPAHFLLRLRRRRHIARRLALGCCIHCGYDLRASSGRCPECGRS
jgi:hypothetical protein